MTTGKHFRTRGATAAGDPNDGRVAPSSGSDLADLVALSSDMFAVFDSEDRLVSANPAYCTAYHCDPANRPYWRDIMRANFENGRGPLIVTDDIEAWLTNAVARRATRAFRGFEVALHGGRWIWATETVAADGRMLLYASDITSVRAESRRLRNERDAALRASWTDPLTGVPNRRYIMDRLDEWLRLQSSSPSGCGEHSLAVLDLDHFKKLNDFYGHAIGDAVLVSFCQKVVSHIRPVDLFGRIGGEEFLLFMPNCVIETARSRLEGLQALIASGSPSSIQTTLTYTFSAGLAVWEANEDIHDTIRRADRLLYSAKAEGRARVQG